MSGLQLSAEASTPPAAPTPAERLRLMRELERKILWLSTWMIHNANHLRPSRDGLKVGGHQASSASLVTLMTALYFDVLRPQDRVAVKPHASPVFHAIQYLLGFETREQLERFRRLGGAQSYPSRTKDGDDVDFSTGSVGLGVALTSFASLVQDYVRLKGLAARRTPPGRMVALVGDAELDEGNIYEALLEGWKHDLRNVWWVIDYNRQSLDAVVTDRLFGQIDKLFDTMGWRVVTIKHGKLLQAAIAETGGDALRQWIDDCPNSLYSALTFKGGAAWREQLKADLAGTVGIRALLDEHDDDGWLQRLMTNLGGHDLESVLEAFHGIDQDDRPTCFIAYTIKGFGLPFAGHKDNHAGLMNLDQMASVPQANAHARRPGVGPLRRPRERSGRAGVLPRGRAVHRRGPAPLQVADPAGAARFPARCRRATCMSTQDGFGQILAIWPGDSELAERIVTTSPDVTVSTNLGGFVNRRGIFDRRPRADVFREQKVVSAQRWAMSPQGQHIELGIAENNLFVQLAALGLSHEIFGARLLPIGTLYDPFIERGLDALNYACYQDARFLVVATPSGISLAPEGGAHQSIATPLIGMAQDGLAYFEPAYVDELSAIMEWAFDYMQREGDRAPAGTTPDWERDLGGGSVYLRLSTRTLRQPQRTLSPALKREIIDGGYWLRQPAEGAELALVAMGALLPEAIEAWESLADEVPGAGLLVVTSPDRLNAEWHAALKARQQGRKASCEIERLLAPLAGDAGLVTVLDGHPATLGWIGSVFGHRVQALGVEHFGQSGDLPDLYAKYGIDANAILDAAAAALVQRAKG